jgi:hypothetical protein
MAERLAEAVAGFKLANQHTSPSAMPVSPSATAVPARVQMPSVPPAHRELGAALAKPARSSSTPPAPAKPASSGNDDWEEF